MKLNTLRFGELEIDEKEIVVFPSGLPGFEHLHQFILVKPDQQIPLSFLQAIEDGDIAFIVTNPFHFYTNYEFDISQDNKEELKIKDEQDVMIWSILSIRESLEDATINLLAPVIINIREQLGKQLILQGSSYRTKHKLMVEEASATVLKKGDATC